MKAAEYYEKAIELENDHAMYNLGYMYHFGELEINYQKAEPKKV